MAEISSDGVPTCGLCGVPIILQQHMIEIDGRYYPCQSCALTASEPARSRRARRGGGLVLTCDLCHVPIIFSEIMVQEGGKVYCCPNNAEVARRQRAAGDPTTAASTGTV
jgi:hypothetical protein